MFKLIERIIIAALHSSYFVRSSGPYSLARVYSISSMGELRVSLDYGQRHFGDYPTHNTRELFQRMVRHKLTVKFTIECKTSYTT